MIHTDISHAATPGQDSTASLTLSTGAPGAPGSQEAGGGASLVQLETSANSW